MIKIGALVFVIAFSLVSTNFAHAAATATGPFGYCFKDEWPPNGGYICEVISGQLSCQPRSCPPQTICVNLDAKARCCSADTGEDGELFCYDLGSPDVENYWPSCEKAACRQEEVCKPNGFGAQCCRITWYGDSCRGPLGPLRNPWVPKPRLRS